MNNRHGADGWASEEQVRQDLQRQPHLFLRLAENALQVAESLRGNYFKNTAQFVTDLRRAMDRAAKTNRPDPVLRTFPVPDATWDAVQGEVVTFIDGGLGQAQIASQVPILPRVGSYRVRTGERRLAEREQFGYYPVILGDLEGGSKERKDFVDIVRITAELLGGLSSLERTPDLRMLMLHGPLVYLVGSYLGHTPFTEGDIDRFLAHYAPEPALGERLKEEFLRKAQLDIYPSMSERSDEWARRRLFEPLAWIAFLYRRLIDTARWRDPAPIIAGVVERGALREFSERVLGECSEPWEVDKYHGLCCAEKLRLPGEAGGGGVNFEPLRPPSPFGFPRVAGCYLHVSETTEPIRIEVFQDLGEGQIAEAARRVYLYARLLPGYGFPVGLDIADKFAKAPTWLTDAYSKLIRYHLGLSLQRGEISDAEMRRILVQAIYMTHRDWLFRPEV